MIRFIMLMALMAGTATAQQAAAQSDDDMAATAVEMSQDADDDDDDDEEEESGEAGVHEAGARFDYGFSGLMARDNRTQLAPLTLAAGKPVATAEYTLKSGGYYRLDINADGSQELALSGGDFFRAIWVNEIVIEDIEIRPMGVHSLEFDDAGTATISFVAVVPGRYTLSIPGSKGETQQAVFNIR
ncbi:hypothetical protein SAMN05444959_10991 [Paracoccus seriniphilus]|uniref:MSP domain-containing protein n=2 Tax=Paracoccus seriniphilus TaxID=184748 RepID=A0A239PXV4_9RHOB|nr:hypothetical protein [Paracoccus seriniphilus]WCR14105.1 hypothetical protein JHW44_01070 [Paracoccus seriniphilus]SNT75010.1 hypothetical protein SAMN05444959_10991 [Paracoccus seriniphilus]